MKPNLEEMRPESDTSKKEKMITLNPTEEEWKINRNNTWQPPIMLLMTEKEKPLTGVPPEELLTSSTTLKSLKDMLLVN